MLPYALSLLAESDLDIILQYTFELFGEKQMLEYNDLLSDCLNKISKESGLYKKIERGGKIIRTLHCKKHYIFALERENLPLLVLAVFLERMDLMKRLKNRL